MSGMSHEHSPTVRVPPRGSVIVYSDDVAGWERQRFRVAEVVGPAMADSVTGRTWFGVLLPDRPDAVDLVDLASVVKVVPPG
jgi:hypothetical protein